MKHNFIAILENLVIRPIEVTDLELLRKWRNDKDISKYFRKIDYISAERQIEWYRDYLSKQGYYYWSIVDNEEVIGALAIYNIRGDSAEIGKIMLGNDLSRGKGLGYKALIMAIKIGFERLGLNELNLNVHENNIAAIRTYEKAGFIKSGSHVFNEEGQELEMIINQDLYRKKNKQVNEIQIV